PPQGAPQADRKAGESEHPRGEAARARRQTRRSVDRRAAPEPGRVQAGDETGADLGDALRRQRGQGPGIGSARRGRDGADRRLFRWARAAPHAAREHRLRLLRGPHDRRPYRRQMLDQQGRGDARGLPLRPDRGRRRGAAAAARARARPWRWGRSSLMLMPKRVKHRKQMRGRMRGNTKGGSHVAFGEYGLKALDRGWITNRQIEAARVAMTRKIKRGGKVWINIFPDKPYTKKPAETRMGSGKGNPEGWVAVVKPGKVMFELAGVPEDLAREAL